jgi:hypothetical protein
LSSSQGVKKLASPSTWWQRFERGRIFDKEQMTKTTTVAALCGEEKLKTDERVGKMLCSQLQGVSPADE